MIAQALKDFTLATIGDGKWLGCSSHPHWKEPSFKLNLKKIHLSDSLLEVRIDWETGAFWETYHTHESLRNPAYKPQEVTKSMDAAIFCSRKFPTQSENWPMGFPCDCYHSGAKENIPYKSTS